MPARQIEIGEQKHQQRRRQDCLAAGAPDALGASRHVEDFAPEAEVDADIDQHRPAECGGGRKHDRALHHEQDREEQREQTGDADDDAVVQGEGIDLVLVGVGLPQIDLRQLVGAEFGDEGDDRAGVERNAENIRGRTLLTHRTIAGRGRDGRNARKAKVGPEQARTNHAVVRNDDQAIDLLVAVIGEREHRPVVVAFARAHLDASHDSVWAGRGRHLDAVAVGFLHLGRSGQIDGGGIEPHVHRFHRARGVNRQQRSGDHDRHGRQATRHSQSKTPARGIALQPGALASPTVKICKQSHPVFSLSPTLRRFRGFSKKRTSSQNVSTILPIWALVSISA